MGQASLMDQVLPQDDDERFRMPNLPPAGGMAVNYGYTPNAMAMPSSMGMPAMNIQPQEFGIVDPTYLAQLAILNQGGGNYMPASAPAAPMGLLGAGLESQDQFRANAPLLGGAPMIADWRAYSPNRSANAELNRAIAMSQSGGGNEGGMGSGGSFSGRGIGADNLAFGILGATSGPLGRFSPIGALANYGAGQYLDARTDYIGNQDFGLLGNVPGGMGTFSDQYGNVGTYSSPATIAAQDAAIFGGGGGGNDYSGSGATGMGVNSAGQSFSDSASIAAQDASMFGGSDSGGGDSGGGGKIVCTAMNEAYGFGSFRNRIWLAYSAKNLTKAHEAGYHALFLPLVSAGYKQDKWFSKPLRAALENIARHRSADLRAEMRGGKRDRVGQAYRFILEPLCYAVGKLKGY
jgi:hypothetical protein